MFESNPNAPRPTFLHHGLDAWRIALEAVLATDRIAKRLGRGYGPLADQMKRSSQSAYLQVSEGAAKQGGERAQRFRGALSEAGETAAAIEAVERLGLVRTEETTEALILLGRLCAMLTKLISRAGG